MTSMMRTPLRRFAWLISYLNLSLVLSLSLSLVLVLVCQGLNSQIFAADKFLVGVSQVDITPPVGFRKAGSYRQKISTGVLDPLYAKAIVFRQGDMSAALVVSDLLSVPPDLSRLAREKASQGTGIPVSNIVVAATHNHGSPEYWGSLRDLYHIPAVQQHGTDPQETIDYQAKLVDAWAKAIVQASKKAKHAELDLLMAQQSGLAFNRRFHMNDGSVRFNPGRGNPQIIRPAGPVDKSLPVLFFRQPDQGRQIFGALTTFALHTAVRSGTMFSGDYPAVLQVSLREQYGNDFVSIFAEGAAGDINHIDVRDADPLKNDEQVDHIGKSLAATIVGAESKASQIDHPDLAVRSNTIHVPFQPIDDAGYRNAMQTLRDQTSQRIPFLTLVSAWRDCHRFHHTQAYGDAKPIEVQAIRLDEETAIVTLPHELFVEIGLAIKSDSPFRNTIVISLANDVDYYIPTKRAFAEGSYEVTTCPLDPGCGEQFVEAALDTLRQVKDAP